jgi:hypothetical protein
MKIKTKKAKSMAMEGSAIPIDELKKSIAKAEKGPFYTPDRSKKLLASWRKKKDSR